MKRVLKLACLVLLGFVSISAWAQDDPGKTAEPEKARAPEPRSVPVPAAVPADYVIGADDTLRIAVWNEANLNATLPVRPDGKISLPLLDDVQAAGLTPMELSASIKEKLKKYVSDPRVTVVVTAMNSQRIFVTGEVARPGTMALLPHMTMLQALAAAGFTQFANVKRIYLLRVENGEQVKLPFNYREVVKGNHPEQNIMLKPGDTIVVP
jgi:polysaccharide export outer membrane protein